MDGDIKLILVILLSYLAGSIPTAVIISKKFFGFDIREKGSGNMGSTNAFRLLGWKWGVTVQIVDILKGVFAVVVIANLLGDGISFLSIDFFHDKTIVRFIAGMAAVCGHIWSMFVGFKGGKGINTTMGMLISIAPVDISIAIGIFLIAVLFSGYVSLGSIAGAIAFPSSLFLRYNIFGVDIPSYSIIIYFALAIAILILYTHRTNISRLLKGTENRFAKLQILRKK
ncbi:MAG TPA: glycerol-3-phosphate 1-O-acyltransferase PlsY [Candidatus Kapabacteria bacterium]|nr:glycerol-3-phosphate 1-O-acyltransferase PlsY [Candidatus Kapabacteria bacterium]HPO63852.1 glycerol-3-phosphate 1-O-acyltransferase PlsY [Candidatus Kapabacteria bacterium]